jgi:hypothetical protein
MSTRMVKPSGNTSKWEEFSLSPSIRRIPHHTSLMLSYGSLFVHIDGTLNPGDALIKAL